MALPNEDRGDLRMMIQSKFWGVVLSSLLEEADRWRRALLTDDALDEGRRKGYVMALTAVRNALAQIYHQAGLEVPANVRLRTGEV